MPNGSAFDSFFAEQTGETETFTPPAAEPVAEVAQKAPARRETGFDAFFSSQQRDNETLIKVGSREDPSVYAEAVEYENVSGVPAHVVAGNIDNFRERSGDLDRSQFTRSSPVVATWMAESMGNAAMARGDYIPLSRMERLTNIVKPVPALAWSGVVEAGAGFMELFGVKGRETEISAKAKQWREEARLVREQVSKEHPLERGSWSAATQDAFTSIYSQAPFYAIGLLARGAGISLTAIGAQSGFQKVSELVEKEVSTGKALVGGVISGLSEALTEMLPFDAFIDIMKKSPGTGKHLVKFFLGEQVGEQVNLAVDTAVDSIIAQDEGAWDNYLEKVVHTAKTTLIQTATMGAVSGSYRLATRKKENVPPRTQNIREMLEAIGSIASESDLKSQSDDKFREVIERLSMNRPISDIHIPADSWSDYWNEAGVDPDEMTAKVNGTEENGMIRMSLQDYAVAISPTEANAFFAAEAKIAPNAMNAREFEMISGAVASIIPDDVRTVYDETVAMALDSGMDQETAMIIALEEVGKTEAGSAVVAQINKAIASARGIETMVQRMGEILPEGAIPAAQDIFERFMRGEVTEEELADLSGLIETAEEAIAGPVPSMPVAEMEQRLRAIGMPEAEAKGNAVLYDGFRILAQRAGIATEEIAAQYMPTISDLATEGVEGAPRGRIRLAPEGINIELLKDADASTFIHETGHLYLKMLQDLAGIETASDELRLDFETIRDWLGIPEASDEITTEQHEKFARGFEAYLREGKAPSSALAQIFEDFKRWLTEVYRSLSDLNVELTDDVRRVFDRLLAEEVVMGERIERRRTDPGPRIKELFQQARKESLKDLFVAHNLSSEGVLAADKLGGLAAPSIAIARAGVSDFTGFGEITLLARPDILDSPKTRTFDADIYSPRQPKATYELDVDKYNDLMDEVNRTRGDIDLSPIDISTLEEVDGPNAFVRSEGMQYLWLSLQGKAPKIKRLKVNKAIQEAANLGLSRFDMINDERVIEIARKHYHRIVNKLSEQQPTRALNFRKAYFDVDGDLLLSARRDFATEVGRFVDSGGNDTWQLKSDMAKKMRSDKTRKAFEEWAKDRFNDLIVGEKLFKGFTPSGRKKYVEYNMQNVLKEMTGKLQTGESFFYGAGTVRAAYANELKTIKAIQAKREKIISESEMDEVKDKSNQVLVDALEKLKPFYRYNADSFGYMDDAGSAIVEGPKGIREAFNVNDEVMQIVNELIFYLVNLPTSYFEAKIQRPMRFDEFHIAVVPKDIDKRALAVLKRAGLKIKQYDPGRERGRQEIVEKQEEVFFQSPARKGIPEAFKDEVDTTFNPSEVTTETIPTDIQANPKVAIKKHLPSHAEGGKYYRMTAQELQDYLDKHGDGFLYRVADRRAIVGDFESGKEGYLHKFPIGNRKTLSLNTSLDVAKTYLESRGNPGNDILYRIMPVDLAEDFIVHIPSNAEARNSGDLIIHSPKPASVRMAVLLGSGGRIIEEGADVSRRALEERRTAKEREGRERAEDRGLRRDIDRRAPEREREEVLEQPPRIKNIRQLIKELGGIDYNREHLKGELNKLMEDAPAVKFLVNNKGKGVTLDRLLESAIEAGMLSTESTIDDVLLAIEVNLESPETMELRLFEEEMREKEKVGKELAREEKEKLRLLRERAIKKPRPKVPVKKRVREVTGQIKTPAMKQLRDDFIYAARVAREAHRAGKIAGTVAEARKLKNVLARAEKIRTVKEYFGLSDADLKKISRKNPLLMSQYEFKLYIDEIRIKAALLSEHQLQKAMLIDMITRKDLKKVDNYRRAMALPTVDKMTTDQIKEFAEALEPFHYGDVFLTERELETVDRTDLKGIRTWREARERLSAETGIPMDKLEEIQVKEWDDYKWDTALAEANPFYRLLVTDTTRKLMEANLRIHEIENEVFRLAKKSEASRGRTLIERAIPQDRQIFDYLEASPDDKKMLAAEMTADQLNFAHYIQTYFQGALEYLISSKSLERGRENYFVHMRRSFLENVKEAGLLRAFRDLYKTYQEDEMTFGILDDDTGNILPLEKFFQFSLRRTGGLQPTTNVTKAFLTYVKTFEKKVALDELIPKMDIYAQSITPTMYTPRGLEIDRSTKKFVNKFINNKKGRRIRWISKQGGTIDVSIRGMRTFTTLIDLGFNIPGGVAAFVGERVTNFAMLGARGYALGVSRAQTKKGKAILKKYESFVGRSAWEEFTAPGKELTERIADGLFGLFHQATVGANKTFLLGVISEQEFNSGELSSARLAEIQIEMGRFRVVPGAKSMVGSTSAGSALIQYKTWAAPILRTTAKDISTLASDLTKKPAKEALTTREAREIYRIIGLSTTVLIVGAMAGGDDDDESFTGQLLKRVYRESLTLLQGVDPAMWLGTPRLIGFFTQLGRNIKAIVMLEEYKQKDGLKGIDGLQRQLTPRAVRQFTEAVSEEE